MGNQQCFYKRRNKHTSPSSFRRQHRVGRRRRRQRRVGRAHVLLVRHGQLLGALLGLELDGLGWCGGGGGWGDEGRKKTGRKTPLPTSVAARARELFGRRLRPLFRSHSAFQPHSSLRKPAYCAAGPQCGANAGPAAAAQPRSNRPPAHRPVCLSLLLTFHLASTTTAPAGRAGRAARADWVRSTFMVDGARAGT